MTDDDTDQPPARRTTRCAWPSLAQPQSVDTAKLLAAARRLGVRVWAANAEGELQPLTESEDTT